MQKELPKRKIIRLQEYDYSSKGCYFITICSQQRMNLFGEIPVGQGLCPCRLSNIGEIINHEIKQLSPRFPNITIDKYVIMPNHVHLLMIIQNVSQEQEIERQGQSPCPTPTIGDVIGALKSISTKKANERDDTRGRKVWQFRYHDHVIRDEEDYRQIWQYIDENPAKWTIDRYYWEDS